jgi:hypothetical protein
VAGLKLCGTRKKLSVGPCLGLRWGNYLRQFLVIFREVAQNSFMWTPKECVKWRPALCRHLGGTCLRRSPLRPARPLPLCWMRLLVTGRRRERHGTPGVRARSRKKSIKGDWISGFFGGREKSPKNRPWDPGGNWISSSTGPNEQPFCLGQLLLSKPLAPGVFYKTHPSLNKTHPFLYFTNVFCHRVLAPPTRPGVPLLTRVLHSTPRSIPPGPPNQYQGR